MFPFVLLAVRLARRGRPVQGRQGGAAASSRCHRAARSASTRRVLPASCACSSSRASNIRARRAFIGATCCSSRCRSPVPRLMIYPAGQTIFHEVAAIVGLFRSARSPARRRAGRFVAVDLEAATGDWVASFGMSWFFAPARALGGADRARPGRADGRASCLSGELRHLSRGRCGDRHGIVDVAVRPPVGLACGAAGAAAWRSCCCRLAPRRCCATRCGRARSRCGANRWTWRRTHSRPRLLLGEALQDAGRRDEAIEQYRTGDPAAAGAIRSGTSKLAQSLARSGTLARGAASSFSRRSTSTRATRRRARR